nr:hypothetical protein [Tanacetum cinerariifolium]
MLLAKKEKDEQVLLAEDHAWMESSSDSDQEINANIVFMAQIEKVLSDSSSSADNNISKASEGEWCEGLDRSGDEKHFWFRRKIPPEKFSGSGRRRRVVAGRQEAAAGGVVGRE